MDGGKGAYSVDVQNIDIRGRHKEVLDKRSDHMPRFELVIADRGHQSTVDTSYGGKKTTHENKTGDNIQPQRGQQRNHNIPKYRIRKNIAKRQRPIRVGKVFDTLEGEKERGHLQQAKEHVSGPWQGSPQGEQLARNSKTHRHINRNKREPNHRSRIPPLTPLRPIPQTQNKTHHQQPQIKIIQYHINRRNPFQIERFILHRFR